MKTCNKIKRKKFFSLLLWLLVVPIGLIWNVIVERETKRKRGKGEIRIINNFSQGVTFFDKIIIVKEGTELKIFSSRCTHLGCLIKQQESESLVCSCHGSRFSIDGEVITGPAHKPLEQLTYKIDNKAGEIIVSLG